MSSKGALLNDTLLKLTNVRINEKTVYDVKQKRNETIKYNSIVDFTFPDLSQIV